MGKIQIRDNQKLINTTSVHINQSINKYIDQGYINMSVLGSWRETLRSLQGTTIIRNLLSIDH